MESLFYKALLYLTLGVLRLVNKIFEIFGYLAGIKPVQFGDSGSETFLTEVFLSNSKIVKVFGYICLIGVMVGAIFTMVSLLKSMINTKKSQSKIFTQYFVSVISMVAVFSIVLVGIKAVSMVLEMISFAFNEGNSGLDIGTRIVNSLLYAGNSNLGDTALTTSINEGTIASQIEIIIGKFGTNTWGLPKIYPMEIEGIIYFKAFPYFIGLLSAGVLCFVSFQAVLQLTVRLYDMIFLMLVMPLPLAAFPLDDGARFKLWKEAMISKMLLAFGVIFAVNIYIIMIGMINKLKLPVSDKTIEGIFKVLLIVCGGFTISAGQLLFARIMGTDAAENRQMAHNFRTAMGGIGTTFGLAKGAFGAVFGKKSKGNPLAAALAAAGIGGAGGAGGDSSIKLGGKIGSRGGLVGTAAKAAGGLGRLLGGNAYKSGMTSLSRGVRSKIKNTKGSFMDNGGLIGMAGKKVGNKLNAINPVGAVFGGGFDRNKLRADTILKRRENIAKGVK